MTNPIREAQTHHNRLRAALRALFIVWMSQAVSSAQDAPSIPAGVLVKASVVDAESGEPIPSFQVLPGTPRNRGLDETSPVAWQPHLLMAGSAGRFDWPSERAYAEFRLRFEADGYAPALSPWIRKNQAPQVIEVRLRRDLGVSSRVLTPDGRPAPHARIAVGMPGRTVRLKDGGFIGFDEPEPTKPGERWRRPIFTTADDEGRYRLPAETGPAMVYAVHDSGIAEVSYEALHRSADIALSAWGSIDGRVVWGGQPGANEELFLSVMREAGGYPEVCGVYLSLTTDDDGRFKVEWLPPWRMQLSRAFPLPGQSGATAFPHLHFDVASGTPTKVLLGGPGRRLVGRLTGLDSYTGITLSISPSQMSSDTLRRADHAGAKVWTEIRQSRLGPVFFRQGVPVAEDGTFEIDHVLPAGYTVIINRETPKLRHVTKVQVPSPTPETVNEAIQLDEIRLDGRR